MRTCVHVCVCARVCVQIEQFLATTVHLCVSCQNIPSPSQEYSNVHNTSREFQICINRFMTLETHLDPRLPC